MVSVHFSSNAATCGAAAEFAVAFAAAVVSVLVEIEGLAGIRWIHGVSARLPASVY